jgi:hypothetical protein
MLINTPPYFGMSPRPKSPPTHTTKSTFNKGSCTGKGATYTDAYKKANPNHPGVLAQNEKKQGIWDYMKARAPKNDAIKTETYADRQSNP